MADEFKVDPNTTWQEFAHQLTERLNHASREREDLASRITKLEQRVQGETAALVEWEEVAERKLGQLAERIEQIENDPNMRALFETTERVARQVEGVVAAQNGYATLKREVANTTALVEDVRRNGLTEVRDELRELESRLRKPSQPIRFSFTLHPSEGVIAPEPDRD